MDSLRVDNGTKNIEVNDNGDYISIPISDSAFYEKFADLMKNFGKKQAEIEQKAKAISENHNDDPENDTDTIIDGIHLYSELCRYTCAELDKLFGEGCCRKVFVNIENPSIELIADFFAQITPLLNQYAKERNQRISLMYSRNRKGARGE